MLSRCPGGWEAVELGFAPSDCSGKGMGRVLLLPCPWLGSLSEILEKWEGKDQAGFSSYLGR